MRLRHSLVSAIVGGDRPSTLFRYNAGSNLGYQGFTFTRADASTCATYVDSSGVVRTVAANVIRDAHYVNGVRTTLLEGSRTNGCKDSGDISTANWAAVAGVTSRTLNAVGPTGGTNSANTLTSSGANVEVQQITATALGAGATAVVSGHFKLGSGAAFGWVGDQGDAVNHRAWINLSTGAVSGADAGVTGTAVNVGNGWYRLSAKYTTTNAYNQRINVGHSRTSGATDSQAGDTALVSCMQPEGANAFMSSYIPTTAAAVTRAADNFSANFPYAPQAMTVYADGYYNVAADATTNYHIAHLGTGSATAPYAKLRIGGALTNVSSEAIHDNGTFARDQFAAATLTYGDRAEHRGVWASDGSVLAGISINGAAEVTSAASGAAAFQTAWSAQTLTIGAAQAGTQQMFGALRSLKITAGVQSMDTMRTTTGTLYNYTPGDPATRTGGTFTRADASTCATYVDANGVVQTVGPNIIRDAHYVNGVRTTLLEGSRTNVCTFSEDLSSWTAGGATVGSNTTVAPDGTTTADTLTRATSAGDNVHITVTFTGNAVKAVSCFVKQGTGTAPRIEVWDNTASAYRLRMDITWSSGVPSLSIVGGVGTAGSATALANGWYRVYGLTTSGVLAANTNQIYLTPSPSGSNGDTAIFWGVQAEDAAFPSSYVKTGAAAVTRAADALSFPFLPVPQAMTVYCSYYSGGDESASPYRYQIGTGTTSTIAANHNGSNQVQPFTYDGSSNLNYGAFVATFAAGDLVEISQQTNADFTVGGSLSKNAGAAIAFTPTANVARTIPAAFSATTVYLGRNGVGASGFAAFSKLVIASGVQSLSAMRAL